MDGQKFDDGKLDWSIFPWKQSEQILKVLMFGAKKYETDNWKKVPNGRERYFAAAIRHLTAWFNGERFDSESKMSHLAHAGCCILFLLWTETKYSN